MKVTVNFCGGLELIVKDQAKSSEITFDKEEVSLKDVVEYVKDNLIEERVELFAVNGSVRPGILVLVNDTDWELLNGIDSKLSNNDDIVFISTLHGG